MVAFTKFEEIDAWQHARSLTSAIHKVTRRRQFSRDFSLRNQVRRGCVSIMANIAEGFERNSDREFIRFLRIASGSLAEVRSHLYVAFDEKYITPVDFERLMKDAVVVGKQIGSLIAYLRSCIRAGNQETRTIDSGLGTGDRGPGTQK